jgi:ABC-type uncharacterized transport system permease subunit
MTADVLLTFFAGILGGALRVGVPFLFVSLGECLTEKSGRINLGLEGVLVLSAMAAFGGAYLSGSAWTGVLVGAAAGALLATLHGVLCSLPRVNDVATGIALMLLGTGLAFYLGKPLIQPQAPQIPAIALGNWADNASLRAALQVNALLPVGLVIAGAAVVGLCAHAHGPAGAHGGRFGQRHAGAGLFGVGHPHRGHGSRRRHRRAGRCIAHAVLPRQLERGHLQRPGPDRGGAGDLCALEPAALHWRGGAVRRRGRHRPGAAVHRYRLGLPPVQHAVPYVLTLLILVITCKPGSVAAGSPGELSSTR